MKSSGATRLIYNSTKNLRVLANLNELNHMTITYYYSNILQIKNTSEYYDSTKIDINTSRAFAKTSLKLTSLAKLSYTLIYPQVI